ncbi:MAG: methylated-DNA--[protein]-cysteine S-methyltransferase [Thiobacillus sp.]
MHKITHTNLSYDAILDFPPSLIGVRFIGEALTGINYLPRNTPLTRNPDQRAKHLANELESYLHHPGHIFDLMFVPTGTPFQLRIWHALLTIPAGKVLSYGALAMQLQTAPRAVGQACGSNPLPLVIPCHRVVSANGLGGFMHAASGAPLDIKAWLLEHESAGDSARGVVPSPRP